MTSSQRTLSFSSSSSSAPQSIIPRKRNLSESSIRSRPPNLRTSDLTVPQPVKEEEDEDDGKDDYGDIGVNNGEVRDEETKEERERTKFVPS